MRILQAFLGRLFGWKSTDAALVAPSFDTEAFDTEAFDTEAFDTEESRSSARKSGSSAQASQPPQGKYSAAGEHRVHRYDHGQSLRPIEFIGGPLDGHRGWIAEDEIRLCATRVGVAISETLFECLHQGHSSIPEYATSMAIYQRASSTSELRYHFYRQQAIARNDHDSTPLFLHK